MTTTDDGPVPVEPGGSLAAALAAFQADLPAVGKSARGQVQGRRDYRYADLADVSAVVLPALAKHGLAWTAMPTMHNGAFHLRYDLMHTSGESVGGWYPLGQASGNQQQMGSAITYARRYCLSAVTGVVPDEDDDGAAASQGPRQQRQEMPQQRQPEPEERESEETGADRRRKAAHMLVQVLSASSRESALNLWKLTKNSAYADVDVSGLLDADDREALGVEKGAPVTIQLAAAKAGKYVAEHGTPVRVTQDLAGDQEPADEPAGAE